MAPAAIPRRRDANGRGRSDDGGRAHWSSRERSEPGSTGMLFLGLQMKNEVSGQR